MGTLSVDKILKTSQGAAEFTLPATDGTASQVMQTDGSGQLSFGSSLPTDSVTATQIATDAVTATEIAAGAVGTSEIAALAVTASEIAATTITPAQIATSTFLANRNRIINGNFDVWQRGTSFAAVTATGYQADRWEVQPAAGCTMTISRQAFTAGQTDVPYEPSYFLRADITTAGSANSEISQKIEDVRSFAGQTIIASFYAKSTAGTQTLNCRFHQDFGSGGSTRVTTAVTAKVLSSSWQKFTFTLTLGSISGKTIGTSSYLAFNFYWANSSTSNDVDLAQVQVEAGSVATPFEYKKYGTELYDSMRYFRYVNRRFYCFAISTTVIDCFPHWEQPMRANPSCTLSTTTPAFYRINVGNVTGSSSTISTGSFKPREAMVRIDGFSGLTANTFNYIIDTENMFSFDAEL